MLYDTNKLTSAYDRPVASGANYAGYPNAGTAYTERRQNDATVAVPEVSCSFGRAFKNTESGDWYLQGGNLICGDKNFFVEDKLVNASNDGEYLVFLRLNKIKANTDDDEEVILPGVSTTSGTPEWGSTPYSEGVNYPDNTNFTEPTSEGTLIVPLGVMTIEDNVVSFGSGVCGNVTVGQCAGVLLFTR